MCASDGFLAGLIGGCSSAAGDQIENGVHPATSLCSVCRNQSLSIRVLCTAYDAAFMPISDRNEALAMQHFSMLSMLWALTAPSSLSRY